MAEQYRNLSLRLYEILDWIGASDEYRDNYRGNAIVEEILSTHMNGLLSDKPLKMYVFGRKHAHSAGFEPAREDPNGFLVHRLNHSATSADEKLCPSF